MSLILKNRDKVFIVLVPLIFIHFSLLGVNPQHLKGVWLSFSEFAKQNSPLSGAVLGATSVVRNLVSFGSKSDFSPVRALACTLYGKDGYVEPSKLGSILQKNPRLIAKSVFFIDGGNSFSEDIFTDFKQSGIDQEETDTFLETIALANHSRDYPSCYSRAIVTSLLTNQADCIEYMQELKRLAKLSSGFIPNPLVQRMRRRLYSKHEFDGLQKYDLFNNVDFERFLHNDTLFEKNVAYRLQEIPEASPCKENYGNYCMRKLLLEKQMENPSDVRASLLTALYLHNVHLPDMDELLIRKPIPSSLIRHMLLSSHLTKDELFQKLLHLCRYPTDQLFSQEYVRVLIELNRGTLNEHPDLLDYARSQAEKNDSGMVRCML